MSTKRGRAGSRAFAGASFGLVVGLAQVVSAQPSGTPEAPPPPPTSPAPARVAADPAAEAWFPQVQQPPPGAPVQPDGRPDGQPDGAYVVKTPPPSTPPPQGGTGEPPVPEESYGPSTEGALLIAMIAARPFATSIDADGADTTDDPTGIAAGHVGMRAHGIGITEDLILRCDIEAFIGASTEGVEGEGRGFLSFGLATSFSGPNLVMFRFGAGGALFGNPLVDFQVADLPALEIGYVHIGADGFIEAAPRVAMGVTRMAAFATGLTEPDPAPAVGGRLLAGGDSVWATLDYEVITVASPMHLGVLTACYAQKFAFCLDGRLTSASLDFAAPGTERVTVLSGGISFGLGVAEQER